LILGAAARANDDTNGPVLVRELKRQNDDDQPKKCAVSVVAG
jgi:hypothetical protein